jgi:hypothetical protein
VNDDWDLVVALAPQPRTPAIFFAALDKWKKELIMPSAQQNMVDYLEVLQKPRNMTVEKFVTRVKVMVKYITDIPFPGPNTPMIDATKLEKIIFWAYVTFLPRQFYNCNNSWLKNENLPSKVYHRYLISRT